MARLHFIDNLRWIAILLLFPLHAAFVFCAGWYSYYVLSPYSSVAAHCFTVAIEPWIMPLLFCIAGISTKFALQKRTPLAYLKERTERLLVPFLAGVVLVCPVIAYFALKFHTGYDGSYAGAVVHFFSSVSAFPYTNGMVGDFSVDHLWFILFLFLVSLAALGPILLWRRFFGSRVTSITVPLPVLLLLFVPAWLLNAAGPNVAGYSFLSFFLFFLIGYSLVSAEKIQVSLEENRALLVAVWIALTVSVMWIGGIVLGHEELFWGSSPLFVLTGWTGALALLGTGRHLLNFSNAVTTYLSAASYPVYIIHHAVLVAAAYYLIAVPVLPAVQYTLIVFLSLVVTFACYEIIRRIPVVRTLFGVAVQKKDPV
jgi:peptidoglycan/LPS O-acetylase OafA/YrhL